LSTEVPVGPANGLDKPSAISCYNIVTIPTDALKRHIGYLLPEQEPDLSAAIRNAFDLD
jgi:mRNA interferase MazF